MRCCLGILLIMLALLVPQIVRAQDVAAPPPPIVVAAPPAGGGFWSSVCASCAAKRAAMSNSPLCKLLKSALGPLSALTGGMVPGQVGPSKQDLAAPGSVGAAAKIQADQKEAGSHQVVDA